MRQLFLVLLGATALAACGGTSYGVNTEGIFPPRTAGADYPNWEHMCVAVSKTNATETLNNAGGEGWELVAVGQQSAKDLMCFKRPLPAQGRR